MIALRVDPIDRLPELRRQFALDGSVESTLGAPSVRIRDAVTVDGAPAHALIGESITLTPGDTPMTLIADDTSGGTISATVLASVAAFVAGALTPFAFGGFGN